MTSPLARTYTDDEVAIIRPVEAAINELRDMEVLGSFPVSVVDIIAECTLLRLVPQDNLKYQHVREYANAEFGISLQEEEDSLPLAGYIFATARGGAIFLSEDPLDPTRALRLGQDPPRFRFSAAHELGHFLMDARPALERDPNGTTSIACTILDMEQPKRSRPRRSSSEEVFLMERRANRFATELLMPAADVAEEFGPKKCFLSLDTIDRMTRRYGASLKASAYRYVELSEEPCALVITSAKGFVSRFYPSPLLRRHERFRIPKLHRIGEKTSAYRIAHGVTKNWELMGWHPAKQWFPYCPDNHPPVLEYSRKFSRYNEILTLLTFDHVF